MSVDLGGRAALVTGASGDIGRAVALSLAQAGADVALCARNQGRARELAAVCQGGPLEGAEILAFDLSDASATAAALEDRSVDVLVHAAAAYAPFGRIDRVDPDDARAALEVSLHGALHLTRALVPGMRSRGFGRVVLISSAVAERGGAGQAAYAAAKAGLVGLARSVACEAGRDGVTVNVVAPGLVDTARVRRAMTDDARASLVAHSAAGRIGAPDEVAAAVRFLAGPEAGFVTGAVLPVDGGLRLGLGFGADAGDAR